jgi:hypothetical protein
MKQNVKPADIDFEFEGDDLAKIQDEVYPFNTVGYWLRQMELESNVNNAIENAMNQGNSLLRACGSTYDAIDRAFTWAQSPEGHDYWRDLRESYEFVNSDDDDEYPEEDNDDN